MTGHLHLHYTNSELPELISKIDSEYYEEVSRLCENTIGYLSHVSEEIEGAADTFKESFHKIESELQSYIRIRKEVFVPYIHELSEKTATGHNCSQCSGRCDVQHNMKVMEFNTSIQHIKSIIAGMKSELPPIGSSQYQGQLKILHNEVTLLHDKLIELLYLEKEILLPKILEAQISINAHS